MIRCLLSPTNVLVNFILQYLIRQSWREASRRSSSHSDDDDGNEDDDVDDEPDNVGIIVIVIFLSGKLALRISHCFPQI